MATLEPAHPLLLLVEPFLRFSQLRFEKLRGAARLALARLHVRLVVERRERVCDERDRGRLPPLIADREGHRRLAQTSELGALEFQLDVAAHTVDGLFERCFLAPTRRGVAAL